MVATKDIYSQREMNFCRRCGTALNRTSGGFWVCDNQHSIFNNPLPTAGVFFLTSDRQHVVLSRRAINPGKGMVACIGGFLEAGESIEDATHREITEETGLTKEWYSPLTYFCSVPATYHFQGEDLPVLTSLFWAILHTDAQPKPGDDVAEIVTLPLDGINPDIVFNDDIRKGFKKFLEEEV